MHKYMRAEFCIVLCLVLASIVVLAQDLPFSEDYDEDLVAGEDIKKSFSELDTLTFNYYGANHSFRVLGISETNSLFRIDNKAREISVGDTLYFSIDNDPWDDFEVKLISVDDAARFRLELYDKDDDGSDDNDDVNNTNTTSTNTTQTNTTNTSSTNTSSTNTPSTTNTSTTQSTTSTSTQTTTTQNSGSTSTQTTSSNAEQKQAETVTKVTGGTTINVNFYFPEGSGIGFLIMFVIILVGLLAYKKFRKKIDNKEVIYHSPRKRTNKKVKKKAKKR